jgi:acetyl-CoA acetyltransferase
MAVEAVRHAMRDAGLAASQVNGMLSYHGGDSCVSPEVASDLGIRLDFYMDCSGGGSSTEALIGLATGAIEVGMCETVAIFRSMNGYSEVRIGGTGRRAAAPVGEPALGRPYGMVSAGQSFAPVFMRHMMEYGTTSAQVAAVKVAHSKHASNNPKAYYKNATPSRMCSIHAGSANRCICWIAAWRRTTPPRLLSRLLSGRVTCASVPPTSWA